MKKALASTVAISVLLSTFSDTFILADEINKQQQTSDSTQNEKLSVSQQKEIDKDFVQSGWQQEKLADGSIIYTMDDATMIAKMKEKCEGL